MRFTALAAAIFIAAAAATPADPGDSTLVARGLDGPDRGFISKFKDLNPFEREDGRENRHSEEWWNSEKKKNPQDRKHSQHGNIRSKLESLADLRAKGKLGDRSLHARGDDWTLVDHFRFGPSSSPEAQDKKLKHEMAKMDKKNKKESAGPINDGAKLAKAALRQIKGQKWFDD